MTDVNEITGDDPNIVLDKLNRTLDELIRFKGVLMASLENNNERMDKIDKKLQEVKPDDKTMTFQVEKIEETIESISKDVRSTDNRLQSLAESNAFAIEKLSEFEKNMTEISNWSDEMRKKSAEDSKFTEGMYIELKDHIQDTDGKFRDSEKQIAKIEKQIEGESRLKEAIKKLIAAVME